MGGNAILWCETGLGKSVVATYITSKLKSSLIIVPPHLIGDWVGKLNDWGVTEDKINIIREEQKSFVESKINIISVNRFSLTRFDLKCLNKHGKDSILIVDECHMIKSYKSNAYKRIDKLRDYFDFSLLISATLLGQDTIDYFVYGMIVNQNLRKFYGTFNNFGRENVQWKILRLADGKSIPTPIKIQESALEKYFYPYIYKETYKSAGVTKPTYNYKKVYFDFSESHEKMIKDIKSKMLIEVGGKKLSIDDVRLEDLTFDDLSDIAEKIHNKHPMFYQLMNCVLYKQDEIFQVSTKDEIESLMKLFPQKGYITYSTPEQKQMIETLEYVWFKSNKRGDKERFKESDKLLYVTELVQLNDKMTVTFEFDTTYYDIDKKGELLDSIVNSHNGQKGYLTYYFQGEREYLSKRDDVYLYEDESDFEGFKNSDKKLLVSQIGQIGTGIRLKFCDYIVEFSLYYNLIQVIQSRGRLGYANSDKIINVYSLIPTCKDTKKILDNIDNKLKIHTEEFYKE